MKYKLTDTFKAQGGIASLHSIMLEDGRQAVLRRLHFGKLLNFGVRESFTAGTKIRQELQGGPNIVAAFERGGVFWPYEIIEYIPGINFHVAMNRKDDYLKRNRLNLLRQAAKALAWVHTKGYMHLDVKPENYLIQNSLKDGPIVKLTDFDLARPALDNAPRRQKGTPDFMAPEQFNEKRSFQASDVFAFGIMAYRLMTGKLPFNGSTEKSTWKKQASMSVVPKAPHEIVSDIPIRLEMAIIRALEKPLSKRLPNMMAFLHEWDS
jgi:serine/threonine protein kinase